MLGDDETLRGPGEYEFQVPASGDKFTFWFPDCGQFLKWVDFDGLVQLNCFEYIPVNESVWENINYEIVDDNCVKISIGINGYSIPRKYALSFHNRLDGGIVRFIFHQDAGDGHLDGKVDERPLYWMSDDEYLIAYCIRYVNGYDNYFEIYPECHTKEFAIKCRNADNLLIESLEYIDDQSKQLSEFNHDDIWTDSFELSGESVPITDSGLVEWAGSVFEIRNDSLICNLCKNNGNDLKIYNLHILSDDGRSTRISIRQRYDETSFDKGRIYPYDPEWAVLETGTRWTGGISNGGVFRIPAEGDTLTIESTGLYTLALVADGLVNEEKFGAPHIKVFTGSYYDYDSHELLCGAITHRHKTWSTISFGFVANHTRHERVISVRVRYDAFPNKSIVCTTPELLWPKTFLTGLDRFIFVQPPLKESGKI